MGYFSNGSEGETYQYAHCRHCVHDVNQGCTVWLLHLLYNGDEQHEPTLDALIPRAPDGLSNERCNMFHEIPPSLPGEADDAR